jgi:hypothetical protein
MEERKAKKENLPKEPEESSDHLLIIVRMPNGERYKRRFRPTDTLQVNSLSLLSLYLFSNVSLFSGFEELH